MKIAVDFDGTIVRHCYPYIGKEIPFAVDTLLKLAEDGHRLILWTVRSGEQLEEAVHWCEKRGLHFYAVNSEHPDGALFSDQKNKSPKIKADIYIDDRNLGGLPEWGEIYETVSQKVAGREKKSRAPRWLRNLLKG